MTPRPPLISRSAAILATSGKKFLLQAGRAGEGECDGKRRRKRATEEKVPFRRRLVGKESTSWFSEEREIWVRASPLGEAMKIRLVVFVVACVVSARLYTANPAGESQACRPAVAGAKVAWCLPTESGPLAISQVESDCKYVVTLAGSVVMKTDCRAGGPRDPNSQFPIVGGPLLFDRASLDFNEIVVFEQSMGGNACGQGPLRFLGINRPTAPVKYVLSDVIAQCQGPDPVITLEPHRIRVTWPGDPEVWVYEGGQVHKETEARSARPAPPPLGTPLGKTLQGEINWRALKWWAGEYPLDMNSPNRGFFKVPEVHEALIKLLGVPGYERLQRDFGLMEPVDMISGYLVLKGLTNPHATAIGAQEKAAVAVQLGTGKFYVLFSPEGGKAELSTSGGTYTDLPPGVLKSLPGYLSPELLKR